MRADVEDLVDPEVLAMTRRAHDGQVDRQGRNYYHSHLLPIARLLLPYGVDAATAGLLHDVVEDTALTLDDLVEAIGLKKEELCTHCWDNSSYDE